MTPIRSLLLVLGLAAPLAASAARAQEPGGGPRSPDSLDCVIEPRSVVDIGTPSEGIIDEVLVDRGDVVKKGQILTRLRSDLERINVELSRLQARSLAEVQAKKSQLKLEMGKASRAEELHRRKVIATSTLEEAQANVDLAQTDVDSAELRHKVAETQLKQSEATLALRTIRSPIDGVVSKVNTAAGEYANVQNPLMTVAALDPLHVQVYVPISLFGRIRVGMVGLVRPAKPVGGVYQAKVTVVDRVFDAASGTFGVRLDLPNANLALPAGLKCRVRFAAGN